MPTLNSTGKGQHGGFRRGAGRKRNIQRASWKWLQIGAMLTREEHIRIKSPNLTPAQRCHRLLNGGNAVKGQVEESKEKDLRFACVRIAYNNEGERLYILALDMSERRRRLLTIPPGGDLVDDRLGRWDKGR